MACPKTFLEKVDNKFVIKESRLEKRCKIIREIENEVKRQYNKLDPSTIFYMACEDTIEDVLKMIAYNECLVNTLKKDLLTVVNGDEELSDKEDFTAEPFIYYDRMLPDVLQLFCKCTATITRWCYDNHAVVKLYDAVHEKSHQLVEFCARASCVHMCFVVTPYTVKAHTLADAYIHRHFNACFVVTVVASRSCAIIKDIATGGPIAHCLSALPHTFMCNLLYSAPENIYDIFPTSLSPMIIKHV